MSGTLQYVGCKLKLSHLAGFFEASYVPEGFLQMIYLDTNSFDRQHYRFDYVGRQFLGEVRCLVFDLTPLPKSGKGRFKGRIWAEDQGFTIVRFNGIYTPLSGLNGFNLHFDSWRTNLQPGLWLPAFIFSQESNLKDFLGNRVRFKSQTRLWGYDLKNVGREEEFSQLTIESPNAIQDQAPTDQDRSPVEAEREWQHQAELNVLDRLQRVGLLSPPTDVDKVLETVVNNIEVTNKLDIEPEIRCRVLMTSTLESFTIGHTIVMSRGLIDVLPDEASLATMLAHEMGHVVLGHRIDTQYAFFDRMFFDEKDTFQHFGFARTPAEEQAANEKGAELLKSSPYKDQLGTAQLFLQALEQRGNEIPNLISPHLGDRVQTAWAVGSSIPTSAAPTAPPTTTDGQNKNVIVALPLGGRIKLDPWTDQLEMIKSKPVGAVAEREKMPFEVTPFVLYLTRQTSVSSAETPGVDPASPSAHNVEAETSGSQPR